MKKTNITADNIGTANNTFMKKIGNANYRIKIHFSQTSTDTFNDKVLRLVKVDCDATANGSEVVTC